MDFTCGKKNTYNDTFMLSNTFGFLLADMIFMLINGFLDIGNLIHHNLGLIGYAYCFYL